MKKRNLLLPLLLAALATGCFTKVNHRTFYVLKPWMKEGNSPAAPLDGGVLAYAFDADTAKWEVRSYEDALAGVITSRTTGGTKQPAAQGGSYISGGNFSLAMDLDGPRFFILAVDVQHKLYGFTQQPIGGNVPELYVDVTFYPKEAGRSYTKGKWLMFNDFYVPPVPEEPEE